MTTLAQPPLEPLHDRLTASGDTVSNLHISPMAVPWLPAVSTSREALAEPHGWYQRALATETRVRSQVNVMHLAAGSLSFDERREVAAFTRHTLERNAERVRPFGLPADSYSWTRPSWSSLVKREQHIVSHVGIIYRVVQVGELRVPVGGIAGWMTLAAWRRHGFARAALESATAFIGTQLWAPFALAICPKEDTAFYEHLGWTVARGAIWCEQSCGPVALQSEVALVRACQGELSWPEGPIDLMGGPW
jgi:hypothetical protein